MFSKCFCGEYFSQRYNIWVLDFFPHVNQHHALCVDKTKTWKDKKKTTNPSFKESPTPKKNFSHWFWKYGVATNKGTPQYICFAHRLHYGLLSWAIFQLLIFKRIILFEIQFLIYYTEKHKRFRLKV